MSKVFDKESFYKKEYSKRKRQIEELKDSSKSKAIFAIIAGIIPTLILSYILFIIPLAKDSFTIAGIFGMFALASNLFVYWIYMFTLGLPTIIISLIMCNKDLEKYQELELDPEDKIIKLLNAGVVFATIPLVALFITGFLVLIML